LHKLFKIIIIRHIFNVKRNGEKMKLTVISGSFPCGLKNAEFCNAVKGASEDMGFNARALPLSDGGEDFLETFCSYLGAETLLCRVTDANFFIKNVRYGVKDEAVIISAYECCGLKKTMIKNPLFTTSYGVGEVISLAKKLNKKKVYIGLGDDAVNDCGTGLLCALGCKFYDKTGEEFTPVGNTLCNIAKIDFTEFSKNIAGMEFTVLCGEDNILLGGNGAAATAVKKGASPKDAEECEKNVEAFYNVTAFAGVDPNFRGAGAGGGMGYCFKAFFGAEVFSCAEFMLKNGYSEAIADSDLIIVGEELFDFSDGFTVGSAARRLAEQSGKRYVVLCGENKTQAGAAVTELNAVGAEFKEKITDGEFLKKKIGEAVNV